MSPDAARKGAATALAFRLGTTHKARIGTARRVIWARETIDETARRVWRECEEISRTKKPNSPCQ